MSDRRQISRRTILKGFGTAMALPFLEATAPARAVAAGLARGTAGAPPVRMAFIFVPNGVHIPDWTPKTEGGSFELPFILDPLKNVRDELTVLTGLTHDKGRANGDGAGDHARSASVFLTGAQPRKTPGANIRSGVSADQVAAQLIGDRTRFPSLELAVDRGRNIGNCDSGYSCAYSNNISWAGPATPMAKENDPRRVFDRLFAAEGPQVAESQARRSRHKKSILDFVLEDSRRLARRLGGADRRKLDEYFNSVREIEGRVEAAGQPEDLERVEAPRALPGAAGKSLAFEDHVRLMSDMMVLAFQGDVTRISTFMFARAGSNNSYREPISVSEGHHSLSHHQGNPVKHAQIRKINRYHVSLLAYLLERLKSIPEGDGTLLDNCMIVYGSGLSDGNRHNNENLPILLAGRGGGTIDSGRHVRYSYETPVCNLFLSMLDRMDAPADSIGDSTDRLRGLVL